MPLCLTDIIAAHYFEIDQLAVSPDDREALVVFGNKDMPHEDYAFDVRNRSIWRVDLQTGTTLEFVPASEDAHSPHWSPDGTHIAYLSKKSGRTEIWTTDRNGQGRRQVTHSNFSARNPFDGTTLAWSPDGQRIAYSVFPNGSRYALVIESLSSRGQTERFRKDNQIVVEHSGTQIERERLWKNPPGFECVVFVVGHASCKSPAQVYRSEDPVRVVGWFPGSQSLVLTCGSRVIAFDPVSANATQIYDGPMKLCCFSEGRLRIVRSKDDNIEVGSVTSDGNFNLEYSLSAPTADIALSELSVGGPKIYGKQIEGASIYLVTIDLESGHVSKLTERNSVAGTPTCLNLNQGAVFPFESPSEPCELWYCDARDSLRKVTALNKGLVESGVPKTEVIEYVSDGCRIEGILVLPDAHEGGEPYPCLVYLHGGPESHVTASFQDMISARGESAAHFLAGSGYAVFMPNFRGSSGYGKEFEAELQNYNIVQKPFLDVMAGVDHLVNRGVADPEALGAYGCSFGAWLTAWAVTQTERFKGAAAALGLYDILLFDRSAAKAFYALKDNRLGEADPDAAWMNPDVYKQLSPLEHIRSVTTPTLVIETAGERHGPWTNQARILFNGLCKQSVESVLVCYPWAMHNGGWNDDYKVDYMNRLLAWFDHTLQKRPLPEWFIETTSASNIKPISRPATRP